MKKISDMAKNLQGQKMFQVLAKAKELERGGKSIIHFEIGDPDFDTPTNIVHAARESLKRGETHYTISSGLLELKVAAADVTKKSRGFKPDLNQLLVTPGANYQIRLAIGCAVNPEEEIIIPDPFFVSYKSLIINNGSIPVEIPVHEENEFRLNPEDIEKAITNKTRMIAINSPNNPTGAVMTPDEIKRIYEIAEKHNLYLLSDEIYSRTIYEDSETEFSSPSKFDLCKERTIVINGFSKSYAMTGWRLGIVTGPPHLIERMGLLLESELSCVPPFVQRAGIEALIGGQEATFKMKEDFRKRRDVLVQGLNSINNINCVMPKGAFYAFPNIKSTDFTSEDFMDFMLEEAGVAVCPGNYFGNSGEGYVRLCYANSIENIEMGLERMKFALKNR